MAVRYVVSISKCWVNDGRKPLVSRTRLAEQRFKEM
jgi:hypothetical protein